MQKADILKGSHHEKILICCITWLWCHNYEYIYICPPIHTEWIRTVVPADSNCRELMEWKMWEKWFNIVLFMAVRNQMYHCSLPNIPEKWLMFFFFLTSLTSVPFELTSFLLFFFEWANVEGIVFVYKYLSLQSSSNTNNIFNSNSPPN